MDVTQLAERLSGAAKTKRVDQDTVLFSRGDRTRNMYGLLLGSARLLRYTVDGTPITLHRARLGSFFAEASLFASTYHCDGEASAGSVVMAFPKSAVLELMERDASFARAFCQHMARQVQGLRSNLELRGIRSAEERVVAALSLKLRDGQNRVELPGTWKDFAQDVGLTHEALYRALKRLEVSGRLRRDGLVVWIEGVD